MLVRKTFTDTVTVLISEMIESFFFDESEYYS